MKNNYNLFDYVLCLYYGGQKIVLSLLNPDSITDFDISQIE